MTTGRGSLGMGDSKCHLYVQEGQKGRSGKLQASHPHLSPWESSGALETWKPFPNT